MNTSVGFKEYSCLYGFRQWQYDFLENDDIKPWNSILAIFVFDMFL